MWQLILLFLAFVSPRYTAAVTRGKWDLLQSSIGVSAMHMQLLNNNRVIIFDRTDFGKSNISLPNSKCRIDPNDTALTTDCTAHSVEYDVKKNVIRPLMVLTDVWCSSGAAMPDGRLVQTGGFNDGDHAVRTFRPCNDSSCDWEEFNPGLTQRRWYATNQILPDGRQIIIGGRRQFNYEFYPKNGINKSFSLPLVKQCINNNMEKAVHEVTTNGNAVNGKEKKEQKSVNSKGAHVNEEGPHAYVDNSCKMDMKLQDNPRDTCQLTIGSLVY